MRRNLIDTLAPGYAATLDLAKQRRERHQVIGAQDRAVGRRLRANVRRLHIGPRRRQRAKPAQLVEEHHAVLTPALLARCQHQAFATPRVKRVSDFNLYGRSSCRTVGSSRLTRSQRSSSACCSWSAGYWRACVNSNLPAWKKSTTPLHPCCNGSTSVPFKSCQAAAPACLPKSTPRP